MAIRKTCTEQEEIFCQRLVAHGDRVKALEEAGYSTKGGHQCAQRILKRDRIKARIKELQARQQRRNDMDADWFRDKWLELFDRCMQAEPVMAGKEPTGEYKFDSTGANKALENLAKLQGVELADTIQLVGKDGGPIQTQNENTWTITPVRCAEPEH